MELQRRSEKAPILTNQKDHLTLYPYEDWEVIEQNLMSKSDLQPNVRAFRRFVVAGACECPIDSQGRILIPKNLRDHANLESKVTLAGVVKMIEIWNTDLFDQDVQGTLENFDEIQISVDQSSESSDK